MKLKLSERTLSKFICALVIFGIMTLWVPQSWALSGFQVGTFLLVSWLLLSSAAGSEKLVLHPVLAPAACMALWGIVQLYFGTTVYSRNTHFAVLIWFTNLALLFMAVQASSSPKARNLLLNVLVWFGFILSVVSTLQMYTSGGAIFWLFPSGYTDNVLGPFVNRNQYAAFIELLLPIALIRGLCAERHRILYQLMAAAMIASVIAAASRAGAALVFCETLCVLAWSWKRTAAPPRQIVLAACQIALAGLAFAAVAGTGALWARLQEPDPYVGRGRMLMSSVTMAKERPWMGFGLGNWSEAYPQYATYDDGTYANQAHNDWAQAAAEGGIPALLFMLALALIVSPPAVRSGWGIGVVAFLFHAMVDYPFQQRPALSGLFFVLAGIACARLKGKSNDRVELMVTTPGLRQRHRWQVQPLPPHANNFAINEFHQS